jgi:putative pyoverdin transport system ATP-binding/permease protein
MARAMTLLPFALRRAPAAVWTAVAFGAAGGAGAAGVVAVTGRLLQEHPGWRLLATFAVLALLSTLLRYLAAATMIRCSRRQVQMMATELATRALAAPLCRVEALGRDRLTATFTDDIAVVARAFAVVPTVVVNAVIAVGCFVYLATSSVTLFAIVFVAVVLTIVLRGQRSARPALVAARTERTMLMSHLRALNDALIDLKLHRRRRTAFIGDSLRECLDTLAAAEVRADVAHERAAAYSQLIFFAALAVTLLAPRLGVSDGAAVGAVLTLFYLRAPLTVLSGAVPELLRANVALASFDTALQRLTPEAAPDVVAQPVRWEAADPVVIELRDVGFTFGGEEAVSIGPIDLTIRTGEILMVTGGNGSGKTTLAKLIAGLYEPTVGELAVNGQLITSANRDDYRQLVTGVFADVHLFHRLLGVDWSGVAARVQTWVRRLELENRFAVVDGALSTVDLSAGQRKRVALMISQLDDRPVCIFDEWAAEQDPRFRDQFYTVILPELKAQGKAIVVVTHDQRYFHCGDRLIRMDKGRIVHREELQPAVCDPRHDTAALT